MIICWNYNYFRILAQCVGWHNIVQLKQVYKAALSFWGWVEKICVSNFVSQLDGWWVISAGFSWKVKLWCQASELYIKCNHWHLEFGLKIIRWVDPKWHKKYVKKNQMSWPNKDKSCTITTPNCFDAIFNFKVWDIYVLNCWGLSVHFQSCRQKVTATCQKIRV